MNASEKLREYIPKGDGYNSEFAHDLSYAADLIDQQSAELAALRGFANAIQYDLELENWGAYPKGLLKIYKLIDENGKPTKLLTGEE